MGIERASWLHAAFGRETYLGGDVATRRRHKPSLVGFVVLSTAFVGALAVAAIPGVRSGQIAPLPPLLPGAVTVMTDVIGALRVVSLPIVCLALLSIVTDVARARRSPRVLLLNRLASIEFSGLDQVERRHAGRLGTAQRLFAGTALASLAIVLVGVTSGIEGEITDGPLRPVDALFSLAGPGDHAVILESSRLTFMDDSYIPAAAMGNLLASAPFLVLPFGKHLFNINNASAVEFSIPDSAYAQLSGEASSGDCGSATAVVDDTVGARVRSMITVNGVALRVSKVLGGIAQMNRSIGIIARSTLVRCIDPAAVGSYFGALAGPPDVRSVQTATITAGAPMAVVSESDFKENNRDFWRANATPLLLQIILYLALFSAFAAAGERQSQLQRNARELGILNAAGVDFRTLWAIERRRALRTTFIAALIACPVMVPVAGAFNATELGVHIGVGPTEFAVGISLTLVSMLLASRRAIRQFERSLDLPLAVKG